MKNNNNNNDYNQVNIINLNLHKYEIDIKLNKSLNNLFPGFELDGRINYLDFLYSLHEIEIEDENEIINDKKPKKNVIIDIGTGTSCIYPIIGIKINKFNKIFNFIGIDISKDAIKQANENIKLNDIDNNSIKLIYLLKDSSLLQNDLLNYINNNNNNNNDNLNTIINSNSDNYGPLLQLKLQNNNVIENDGNEIFACMCNPPFFTDINDLNEHLHKKFKRNHNHNHNNNNDNDNDKKKIELGQLNELITIGGDFIFATTILIDSLRLTTKIKWYTCLFGSKISFIKFYQLLLKENININNIYCTSFKPDRIIRWCIAWTFHHLNLPKSIEYDYNYVISRGLKRDKFNELIENNGIYSKSFTISNHLILQTMLSNEKSKINDDLLLNRILSCSNSNSNSNINIIMKIINNNLIECIYNENQNETKFNIKIIKKNENENENEIILETNNHTIKSIKEQQYNKKIFHNLYNYLHSNIIRTNRKWRRLLLSPEICLYNT